MSTSNPFSQGGQFGLDLFGTTAMTPADLNPVGLIRIPMKEDPVIDDDDDDSHDDSDREAVQRGQNFLLTGQRGLAKGWKARGLDNLAAIKLMQEIEKANRPATEAEQAAMIKFCAFSSTDLAQNVFRRGDEAFNAGWETIGADLETMLDAKDRAGLMRATQYAHFTPEYLIRAIWKAVSRLGYEGGTVLEPGCGTGLFMALAPEQAAANSHFTGIEADPVTARITSLLFPESLIRQEDFTKTRLTDTYDLAIGNPPFSDRTQRLTEARPTIPLSLHDYFIARSIHYLRPGGIAAFVVSRWTMDKTNDAGRRRIAQTADLLAAVRLPAGAMRADAGTDVVVDLLFFQARYPGQDKRDVGWFGVDEALAEQDGNAAISVNQYFVDHPEMVLGRHDRTSSQFGMVYTCRGETGPALESALSTALETLPIGIHTPQPDRFRQPGEVAKTVFTKTAAEGASIREGSYLVIGNRLHQVTDGKPAEITIKRRETSGEGIPLKSAQIIDSMIAVRDAVRAVLRAQEAAQDGKPEQIKLRLAYGRFVRSFGPINKTEITSIVDEDTGATRDIVRRPNLTPFNDDPDVWLVASIEDYDQDTGQARHGAIFNRVVVHPPVEPKIVTAADALTVCLHDRGSVDIHHIADLLGSEPETIARDLTGAIFLNPETDRWETADAYLSGPVRTKLAIAEATAATDQRFAVNVEALRAAQPTDLKPSEITARLGAPWIPADTIAAFSAEILGVETPVRHTKELGAWSLDLQTFAGDAASRTEWGTERRHAGHLLDDALNSSVPKIFDIWMENGQEKRELNAEATEAAKEKLTKIKTAFQTWIWTEAERAERLTGIYNLTMNNMVPRHFDGSHLTLPGASSVINFYPHQKRGVWRIVSDGSTYLAHAVGAGKTYTMSAAVMEQKRLGLITKAMMVVPGHCLAQASREFLLLYPTARILVADETNFAKAKRKRFIARAATGDWDCIIITHSAFKFIPIPDDFERGMILAQIAELEDLLGNVDGEDRISRKRIERMKEGYEEKLESMASSKDDLLTISEMGIDQLIVDEAQEFRKLAFATNQSTLKGVDPDGSQRAWDLFVKVRFIETINPGRALVEASGTPITNTMGELYTLQRFFAEDTLKRMGLQLFDGWSSNFGDQRTDLELQPSGQYKPVTRFSEFVNVPELIDIFRSFADVVQKSDLREYLKLPRIAGGKRQLVTVEPTPTFKRYQQFLDRRIKAIEERKGKPEKGDDILLSVITDGRHAAIDLRLVADRLQNDPASKLNAMIEQVWNIYQDTSHLEYLQSDGVPYLITGAGQFIFSDLGTLAVEAKRGFSAYRWIRDSLIARGIPGKQIAFMQNYRKSADKQRLFAAFNAGAVRILIGSSQTMGTGVNAQKRLKALHHLDVPWLPSDIEQREGRIERQGNQNDEIELYAYATLSSMDATMWQNNERKQRFIEAAMSGDRTIRRLEDAGSQSNQFAMAKAIASGDPRLMQKAGLESEIARLMRLSDAHIENQIAVRRTIANAQATMKHSGQRVADIRADIARRLDTRADAFAMVIDNRRYTDRKPAGAALIQAMAGASWERSNAVSGNIGGFAFTLHVTHDRRQHFESAEIRLQRTNKVTQIEMPDSPTPLGVIARLEAALDRFEAEAERMEIDRDDAERRLADFEPRLGKPFELQGELDGKSAELAAIEKTLAVDKDEAAAAIDGQSLKGGKSAELIELKDYFDQQRSRSGSVDPTDDDTDEGSFNLSDRVLIYHIGD